MIEKVVYFFNDSQQMIKIVDENQLIEVLQTKEITANKQELLNDRLSVTASFDRELRDARYMAVKEENDFSMYRIIDDTDQGNHLLFNGIGFGPNELDSYIVKKVQSKKREMVSVIQELLKSTEGEWRLGHADTGLSKVTQDFIFVSVKEALKYLQSLDCEILFRCNVTGKGITDKWIEVYHQIGDESNTRFDYGDNALTIVKERDRSEVYTSLIGQGKKQGVGTETEQRVEFTNIEWKKELGNPLDKPKGQNWLEYPEMTALHGIPTKKGRMRKREQVLLLDDLEDPKELLERTYLQLIECSRPLVQFKTTVFDGDAIGNIVTIHRYDRDYHYKTRVYQTKLNRLTGQIEASLGDNLSKSSVRQSSSMRNSIQALDESKTTFYESEEISKQQSDIIRGANGGSVLLMSPSDLGKSTSREPFQMIWMNGSKISNSNHFLVANSDGIGFIKGEFDLDNLKTAWTIDGKFNADYIAAGKIKAIDIEGVNISGSSIKGTKINGSSIKTMDAKDFQVVIENGGIDFEKRSKELHGEGLGSIYATYGGSKINGFAIIQKPGYIFSINSESKNSSSSRPVFQVPKESTSENILYNVYGNGSFYGPVEFNEPVIFKKNVKFNGQVEINGKLFVGGKEIIPGQGGGPGGGGGTGTGGYPPELSTNSEKWAWDLWIFLVANGYTKQAAAGILGNVQGETGSMNPDTAQINGPAYGIVQWDGSAYSLVGSQTWDGREYVQRLMAAAGITTDYKTMSAQSRLLEWSMYNGQWLGRVSPTSVSGFKLMTDAAEAATVFERNYERPAATHPERRQYAIEWYNKFKDLKASTTTGESGLKHLETLVGKQIGNGQCYGLSAEYSGYLGGCGLGAGTQYALSHVIGNTSAASDIGIAYDWGALGWKVVKNPSKNQLAVGAIINWSRGGRVSTWYADATYGHTGVIRGLNNGKIQTYEQNTELGMICGKLERDYYSANDISSIVIPPK